MEFYSLGKNYEKDLSKYLKIKNHNAEPAQSLNIKERQVEHLKNPKPSVHERFNQKFYLPSKYLNPYGSPHSSYPQMVVSSSREPTDRIFVSPENPKGSDRVEISKGFQIATERVA
jgi:hypothetical protein